MSYPESFIKIQHLSNEQLERQLIYFAKQERKLLHVILEHIKEVDRRKLYLQKARSSLFEYLVKDFNSRVRSFFKEARVEANPKR